MTRPRSGFLSPDRVERSDHRRQLVRRAAAERNLSETEVGARLGYTRSRWQAIMTNGELDGLRAEDLAVLGEVLGADTVLEELAAARGKRLVPAAASSSSDGEVLDRAGAVLAAVGNVSAVVASALPDGVNPMEARAILAATEKARRTLDDLEARVAFFAEPRRSAK
jgi:hypothetical protein